MKNNPLIVTILVLFAVIQGCSNGGGNHAGNTSTYIALDSFINARVDELSTKNLTLTKHVRYEDTIITTTIDSPDLRRELDPFMRINVPEVSWRNNYAFRQDTVKGKLVDLYVSVDSTIELKRFAIHKTMNGEIKQLHFNFEASGMLSQSDQLLIWKETDDGLEYRIQGEQNTRFFGEEIYQIEGKITTKN